jgi:serine/threonine protein kinase
MENVLDVKFEKGHETLPVEINFDFSLKTLFAPEFGIKDLDLLETIGTGVFGRTRIVRSLKDRNFYALKIMKKVRIVKQGQLHHVQNEIKILSRLRCPFVQELRGVFQDENSLYLVLEFIPGGELFSHLRRSRVFDLPVYQFVAVEIACALYHMHKMTIIYRDLKPENILINRLGHIRLTEFSLAKLIKNRTYTLCGTPEYVSPEIINGEGYGYSADWWAFGILLHEMCVGFPPFYGRNPFTVYRKILEGNFPTDGPSIPATTWQAVKGFLTVDRSLRLGCQSFEQVKSHPFFDGVDWNSAFRQLIVPPMVPTVISDGDTSNFDFYPAETIEEPANLSQQDRMLFESIDEILDRSKQVI